LRILEIKEETARLVVVALVVVEFEAVKDWKVDEPLSKRLLNVPRIEVSDPIMPVLALI
jgi:hypothetical protein